MSDEREPHLVAGHQRTDMEIRALYECIHEIIYVIKRHNCPTSDYATYHQLGGAEQRLKNALNIKEEV